MVAETPASRLATIQQDEDGYAIAILKAYGHRPFRQFYADLDALIQEHAAILDAGLQAHNEIGILRRSLRVCRVCQASQCADCKAQSAA